MKLIFILLAITFVCATFNSQFIEGFNFPQKINDFRHLIQTFGDDAYFLAKSLSSDSYAIIKASIDSNADNKIAVLEFLSGYNPVSFIARNTNEGLFLDYVLALDNFKNLWLMKTKTNSRRVDLIEKLMVNTHQTFEEKIYVEYLKHSNEISYDIYFCTTIKEKGKCKLYFNTDS